jgi:hypothetical protein
MFALGIDQAATDHQQRHSQIWDTIWHAISSYSNNLQFRGRITYLCADEQVASFPHVTTGWKELCTGGLDVQSLPGTHIAHINTFRPECAEAIRIALVRARNPIHTRESSHASISA